MDFSQLVQQSEAHAWLYVPTAIALGALHGLEPGHSKTMMAAFIIAVRGTIAQAVMLGLSAAISHSLIIWGLAAAALRYGSHWNAESTEPYFQIASGIMIAALAGWMFWRTRREAQHEAEHRRWHEQTGAHGGRLIDTGHGLLELAVFENGVPPRFRVYLYEHGRRLRQPTATENVSVATRRDGGVTQDFQFGRREDDRGQAYFESHEEIPEPHEFTAFVTLAHADHAHRLEVAFSEDDHAHDHNQAGAHPHAHGHAAHGHDTAVNDLGDLTAGEYADAHERAHAEDIARRFQNRSVTTAQIIWFGVTGGLMPCPAAFTILLVCLQLKRFSLGFALVGCFSFGLALTMVASGVLAAWGVRHAERRIKGFGRFARRAPYFSAALLTVLALFFIYQGWAHLPR